MRKRRNNKGSQCKNCALNSICSSKVSECNSFKPYRVERYFSPQSKKQDPVPFTKSSPELRGKYEEKPTIFSFILFVATLLFLAYIFTS